jgi:hypothetical protein
MKPLAALVGALLPLIASSLAVAGQVVPAQQLHLIDFESLPGMPIPPPFASRSVPAESSLTDQFKDLGILFGFDGSVAYGAVVALGAGHATSGVNGIGGVLPEEPTELRPNPELDFSQNIFIRFIDPQRQSQPGTTDFFSIRGDLIGGGATEVTVRAFDAAGAEIASATRADVGGQTWTLSAPGMSRIILPASGGETGDIAFDDLRFAPVRAIPLPPALVPGVLMLLAIIATRIRRMRQT